MNFKLLVDRLDSLSLTADFCPVEKDLDSLNLLEQEKLDLLAFYGINFSRIFPVEHDFGYVDVGQYRIACYYWGYHPRQSKGTILLMHGLFDHIGLLKYMIEYGLRRGYSVVTFDLPGHGLSTGERAAINEWSEYVAVLKKVIDVFQVKYPKPWHVIAQSTGGAVLMDYLIDGGFDKTNSPFKNIILLAPLVRPKNWTYSKLAIVSFGWLIGNPVRAFTKNSNDPEFLRFIREDDPLQPQVISLVWLHALMRWMKRFKKLPNSQLSPVLIQGGNDGTVNGPYNIKYLSKKFNRPMVHWIPEARHQLINESTEIREKIMCFMDHYFMVDNQ